MGVRVLPAVIAVVVGALLVAVAFVPYVARSYRRRGELGPGRSVLAAAALVYALAVVAYALLPLPQVDAGFCASRIAAAGAQLHPLQFLADIRAEQVRTGLRGLLGNPAVQQVAYNVALFVPFGMLVRHLGGRSTLLTTVAGFAVSLLIEFTQLTGNWFLYPCPYRLFDVDDLLANTAGALLGALAAPVLRLLPGQDVHGDPDAPRPVTTRRRLHGVACDLIGVWLAGGLLGMVVNVVTLVVTGDVVPRAGQEAFATAVTWTVWLVLFAVVPVLGRGGTLGQRAVLLRPVLVDGARPSRARLLARSLAGIGGFLLLNDIGGAAAALGLLWGIASLVGILRTRGHRGLGGLWTGTVLRDRRCAATG